MNIPATDELARRRRATDVLGRTEPLAQVQTETARTTGAVSWGAIFAGAVAAAAMALILTMLGTGMGLLSVSPWDYEGASVRTIGFSTIIWLTITQLIAAGLGGYLAGRLRTKWLAVDADEVYFRDTAHGFLAWALSALLTAALLSSLVGAMIGGGLKLGGTAAAATMGGAAMGAGSELAKYTGNNDPMKYFMGTLFRQGGYAGPAGMTMAPVEDRQSPADSEAEVTRIFANSLRSGPLPPEDVRYAGQVVSQRTGLPQAEAEKRVTDTYARIQGKLREAEANAKSAVDSARKASAYASLWFFISLLIGAFCASYAATYGGRQRDM